MTKFENNLFRKHVEVGAWPDWMRRAVATGGIPSGAGSECDRKYCPCHKAQEIMAEARARVTAMIDAEIEIREQKIKPGSMKAHAMRLEAEVSTWSDRKK